MKRPPTGTVLRVLAPLLAGAALGVILQAVAPRIRLYTSASPGLVAGIAGLLGTGRRGGCRGQCGGRAAGGRGCRQGPAPLFHAA
jgi:hypothetical protein